MNVVLFEDDSHRTLAPLTYARPVFYMRNGAYTADERVRALYPDSEIRYLCRQYLAPSVKKISGGAQVNTAPDQGCLFLNGAALAGGSDLARLVEDLPDGSALISDRRLLAAKVGRSGAFELFGYLQVLLTRSAGEQGGTAPVAESLRKLGIATEEAGASLARFVWDIIGAAEEMLAKDWALFKSSASSLDASVSGGASLISRDSVHIGAGVRVETGAVIDASEGPVILDHESKVMANTVIYGPCYVGRKTLIKAGAKIYGPCSLGPVCKLGGEIAETIVQGYSNKQHDGFLGHAYLGEWVNMGAGTEVSDLKNNYGPVKVWVDGVMVDSGEVFVGPTIGDHTKTGINSMLNSGCVIGFCSNVFGSGYLPKFIPSFSWGGGDGLSEYDPAKAMETARVAMSRRGVELDEAGEALFREIYDITRPERD